jgi:tetratricopeptide (TPR) repeat protein
MTLAARRLLDVAWPLALLVIFLSTFRGSTTPTGRNDSVDCESPDTLDTATLERCLMLHPRHATAMAELGDRYARARDSERAETMYRRAIAVDPRDGEVRLRLGELLLRRGDVSGSLAEAEAALATLPGSRAAEDLVERARESEQ